MLVQIVRQLSQVAILTLWRRKSMILVAAMFMTVLIICLQYNSVGGQNDEDGHHQSKKNNFPLGMDGEDSRNHKATVPRRNLSAIIQPGYPDNANQRGIPEIRHGQRRDPIDRSEQNELNPGRFNRVGEIQQQQWDNEQRRYHGGNTWQRSRQVAEHQNPSGNKQQQSYFIPEHRLVHLDLKGAPPKIAYYKQFFPLIKEAGATGILLEYEDMFPYWGPLASTISGNAYTREDIATILQEAQKNNLEVIPLVQTFGHLEYVLKLEEFKKLREVDDFPQAICPSKNESFNMVKTIIDQVMQLHPNVKWLHIGCDEVYHLGYCSKCIQQDRDNLFLSHVVRVARYVREKYNVLPIIWDDMLRQMTTEKLKQFKLGSLVEPMVWTYVKDIYRFIPYNIWLMYSEVFPYVWAASAFKGAFGETLTVPNVKMHLENNEAWLEVMSEQHKKFESFRGVVITGWQRYDHLATLCELLPSAIPSLFINLLTVSQGFFSMQVFAKFQQILQCTSRTRSALDFESDPHMWQRASGCFFPGSGVFRMTQHHQDTIKRINDYLYDVTVHKAWLTDFNIRHNITSPMRVDEGLTEYSSNYYPLTSLIRTARDSLREVYDEFTVAEWIEQNIYPYIVRMEKLWKDGTLLKKARVWPKRPLPPLDDLKRFQVGEVVPEGKNDAS